MVTNPFCRLHTNDPSLHKTAFSSVLYAKPRTVAKIQHCWITPSGVVCLLPITCHSNRQLAEAWSVVGSGCTAGLRCMCVSCLRRQAGGLSSGELIWKDLKLKLRDATLPKSAMPPACRKRAC